MRSKLDKILSIAIFFIISGVIIVKFAGPRLLKLYVESGVGRCQELPFLCATPAPEAYSPEIDKRYLARLKPGVFSEMAMSVPEGFRVIKERVQKIYYRKHDRRKHKEPGSTIYLMTENAEFFTNLFPKLKKQGVISDDFSFFKYTLSANPELIAGLNDAFFVIVKAIFTPYIGDQKNVRIVQFSVQDKKGFITYNISERENYFDCNFFDRQGIFFKIYIKDIGEPPSLDLEKVITIISSVKTAPGEKNVSGGLPGG